MSRTVLHGGRVFDGTGSPVADADVVISGGQIVDVGTGLDGDEQVDVSGLTLLPGLFDCHVHVMVSGVDLGGRLQRPFSYQFFQAARNLSATLDCGITTVRDAGGADLGVQRAVADGLIDGPQMQIAITALSQTGGHGDGWLPSGMTTSLMSAHPGRPSGIVDGPEEMRKRVREVIRAGANVIKVHTSGGVLSPRDSPRHAQFRPDELAALIAEATAARWMSDAGTFATAAVPMSISRMPCTTLCANAGTSPTSPRSFSTGQSTSAIAPVASSTRIRTEKSTMKLMIMKSVEIESRIASCRMRPSGRPSSVRARTSACAARRHTPASDCRCGRLGSGGSFLPQERKARPTTKAPM